MLNICFDECSNETLSNIYTSVICLPLYLSLGSLRNPFDITDRLHAYMDTAGMLVDSAKVHIELYREVTEKKMESARIWYSSANADELCGLYMLSKLLEVKKIHTVNCSTEIHYGNTLIRHCSVNQLSAVNIETALKYEKIISNGEVGKLILEWEKIVDGDAPLRIAENDSVVSVNIDYYDDLILENVAYHEVLASKVIASCLDKIPSIQEFFIGTRIKHLIDMNKLIKTKPGTTLYQSWIKRA